MGDVSKYINELDLYLFDRGEAKRAYLTFGCHRLSAKTDSHIFVVWAPNAKSVSVVGDFNDWDAQANPMQNVHNGVWGTIVKGLHDGDVYKYAITDKAGKTQLKADPFAVHAENGLSTASKVWDLDGYEWQDEDYMQRRHTRNLQREAMSIYEFHLGSWKLPDDGGLPNYRNVADGLVAYCKKMGYTHVEPMPLTEYPLPASWGYQTTGYYAITSRYGTPQDFMYFVDVLHEAGIGIIMDWVPAHFPRDSFALAKFDGTPLFEYADPRKGEHKEWGTLVFDYGRPQVVSFLVSAAMFLFDTYHIDGLRVDAVSSMLYLDYGRTEWVKNKDGGNVNYEAVEFLQKLNSSVLESYPGAAMVAEESTAYPMVTMPPYLGGLGFTFKWNMGFMHDVLDYSQTDPLFRAGNHHKLTFSMDYAYSESYILEFSHDEVVYGKKSMVDKMFGEYGQKFATYRAILGHQFAHPGKKLTFMGSEFAQFSEWNFERELEWEMLDYEAHRQMQGFCAALNHFYLQHLAFWMDDADPKGFIWANRNNRDQDALAFLRLVANGGEGGEAHDAPVGAWGADANAGNAGAAGNAEVAGNAGVAGGVGGTDADMGDAGSGKGDVGDASNQSTILCCFNYSPNPIVGLKVGLPSPFTLIEVFNSDDVEYGGRGRRNAAQIHSHHFPFEGQPYSATVNIPPLSCVYFECVQDLRGERAMSERQECMAMILAGGQGSRLGVLTRNRAKPAVPYGGKYRIIDFTLSNCANSGLEVVGVLTQYEPFVLNSYIGTGASWDLDSPTGGVFVLSPYTRSGDVGNWYSGTANAIYQNIDFVDRYSPDYLVVLSGDHIYKMDYAKMVRFHKGNKADVTIAARTVPIEEASRFGILDTDGDRVVDFVEKPEVPPNNLASMGVYVFNWEMVRKYLQEDAMNADSSHDFGKDIIPAMLAAKEKIYAYDFDGYWRDVGTVDSLWEANMGLLDDDPNIDLFDGVWRIYSRNPFMPAAYVGDDARLETCMVPEGCEIYGKVTKSVLFQGVRVDKDAEVEGSVIMQSSDIGVGARISRTVMAENVSVGAGAKVGGDSDAALVVIGEGASIMPGAVVLPGSAIEPGEVVYAQKGDDDE